VRIQTQDATHPASYGLRSTLASIIVNLCLATIKGVAGVVGSSYALIADAIESMTDVLSSFVVFVGLRVAMRPPDANHPYGHGKAEPMAAVAVSVGLLAAAIAIAVESIHEIRTPHTMPAPFTLLVLPAVVIVKETMFRFVNQVGTSIESGAVKTDAWHHRSDALTSALAFVGISIALIGGPGWESADDWAALLASGIIAFNAYLLVKPAIQELGDALPGTRITQQIQPVAATVPGVIEVEKCFVRKMGFDYYVDLHVVVEGDLPVRRGHEIAHQVKDAIQSAYPMVADVLVHIEPNERH
jgi:cation diffusion facilitator family transporter